MISAYDKLERPIQKWVRNQGWKELRDIQARATHIICDSEDDLIVAASTASGKTEAAFLPLISNVLRNSKTQTGFDLVYIGPLKALINDQTRRFKDICSEIDLPIFPWHGDVSASIKSRALKKPRGILLITPESLEALFVKRGLELSRLFSATQAIVIDELHTMLDSERGIQLQSLLSRLELRLGRSVRRVGLSATLGDMKLTRDYLRQDNPEQVQLIEGTDSESELQLQLRGYIAGDKEVKGISVADKISKHIFQKLRGKDNLVFAGSRKNVEIYSDKLRLLCEEHNFPQEFYPHHGSLSRDHRDFVEERLKDSNKPTTSICTSTLELGIDIGDVACVAQIGAPYTVASLRQRLGRSGRRIGQPAMLRQYSIAGNLGKDTNIVDRLRLNHVRSIAMIELLLDKWCEPPQSRALHLSTFVHQIMSIIAERGGASAQTLYLTLCTKGVFKNIPSDMFGDVLRSIGHPNVALIEQASDGLLLLGKIGESLVEHYSFYAVFKTSDEYRLITNGQELGSIPIDNVMRPGTLLIFSGRRWVVQEVSEREKVIVVLPAKAGVPPMYDSAPGIIHDMIINKMFEILRSDHIPIYLDSCAISLLNEARANFGLLKFARGQIACLGEKTYLIATQCGTVKSTTLAFALQSYGFQTQNHDGFIEVSGGSPQQTILSVLETISGGGEVDLFNSEANLEFEKYHEYLTPELLKADVLSSRFDKNCLQPLCAKLIGS